LAVMGLLSDFFLQTFFVAAVLAVDMNRVELRDAVRRRVMAVADPLAAAVASKEARRLINHISLSHCMISFLPTALFTGE